MTSKEETLSYLYGLQKFGIKLGLRNIERLLGFWGNPHLKFPSVHIAGTNGKGSTASLIASMLMEAGYSVGLYTSPHLIQFNERIRVDGKMIDDDSLVNLSAELRALIDALQATFFEATTAMAFQYFASEQIDIAVIETGLGGRLDATNVVFPLVTVITSIAKDHTEELGNKFSQIAEEKGGIIKPHIPCVIGSLPASAEKEISRIGKEKESDIIRSSETITIEAQKGTKTRLSFLLDGRRKKILCRFPLAGEYQLLNLKNAAAAIELLQECDFSISQSEIKRGIENVQINTGLHGRMEIVNSNPDVLVDVGHNPEAVESVVQYLERQKLRKIHLLFGVMRDKGYRAMIRSLLRLNPLVYAVQPETPRALKSEILRKLFTREGHPPEYTGSVYEGFSTAWKNVKKNEVILIIGSHFVAGEAMTALSGVSKKKRNNSNN